MSELQDLRNVINDLADRPDYLVEVAEKWKIPWELLQIAAEAGYGIPLQHSDDFNALADALAAIHVTELYELAQRAEQAEAAIERVKALPAAWRRRAESVHGLSTNYPECASQLEAALCREDGP